MSRIKVKGMNLVEVGVRELGGGGMLPISSVASSSFQFPMWLGCIVGLRSLPANKRFELAPLSCVAYSIVGVRKVVEYMVS